MLVEGVATIQFEEIPLQIVYMGIMVMIQLSGMKALITLTEVMVMTIWMVETGMILLMAEVETIQCQVEMEMINIM